MLTTPTLGFPHRAKTASLASVVVEGLRIYHPPWRGWNSNYSAHNLLEFNHNMSHSSYGLGFLYHKEIKAFRRGMSVVCSEHYDFLSSTRMVNLTKLEFLRHTQSYTPILEV